MLSIHPAPHFLLLPFYFCLANEKGRNFRPFSFADYQRGSRRLPPPPRPPPPPGRPPPKPPRPPPPPPPKLRSARGRASLTLIVRPLTSVPLKRSIALLPASVSISTKPKPRERPVSRSVTMEADSTAPTSENRSAS